jgi:PAS domain S-box-containing protein
MKQEGATVSESARAKGKFSFRRVGIALIVMIAYVLLDRSTVYFQIWPGISAWYPPTGLGLAVMIALGPRMFFPLLVASCVGGVANYHQPFFSYMGLVGNPAIVGTYAVAAYQLRSVLKIERRLIKIRDVIGLLFVSAIAASVVAGVGTGLLIADGELPRAEFMTAAANWWVGDIVALTSLSPFLLVFVMPWVLRFAGSEEERQDDGETGRTSSGPKWTRIRPEVEWAAFAASILLLLWIVLLGGHEHKNELFYLFFLPLIWIAMRRGLRGATAGIMVLNLGIILILRGMAPDTHRLVILQFMMLILSITGLAMGALISERDRTESRLEDEEERTRLLLESTGEAIYGVDHEGRCIFCNPACLRLLGYQTREELLGRSMHELIHHTKKDGSHYAVEDCPYVGASAGLRGHHSQDDVLWRADRTSFSAEIWSHPVHHGEKLIGWVVGFVDITERKQTQESLQRAKDEAEAANRAKSEFLANMSHEIRTPMNGILGMAELALETELTGEQREYVSTMKSSGESLLNLLNDLLDFSKIEAQKMELEMADFSPEACVEDALQPLGPIAHKKGIQLLWDIEANVPRQIRGDATRLRQVIINLAGNALKFTEKGEVAVRVAVEEDGRNYAMLRFSVSDTGIGIPTEKQGQIFEAFAQADMSTTRRFGGTGLGLTICKKLVKLMGGRMWLESEPGRGSRFHFTVRALVAVAPFEEASDARAIADAHVLVVEQSEANAKFLSRVLRSWNMVAVVAETFGEALEMWTELHVKSRNAVAVLLSDSFEMEGTKQFSRKMEAVAKGRTPIILMTSRPWEAGQSEAWKAAGVVRAISMPFRRSSLFEALQAVTGKTQDTRAIRPSESNYVSARKLRILLAEDNVVNQKLMAKMLEKMGHEVAVAADGQVALQKLAEQEFDLVAMDMQMPVMDGIAATLAIRAQELGTGRHIGIVAMTANAFEEDRQRCMDAGMDGYIAKPVATAAVREEIARVMKLVEEWEKPETVPESR